MRTNWMRPFAIAAAVVATVAGVAFATRGGGVAPAAASAHARIGTTKTGAGGITIQVTATTGAHPNAIAQEIAWN